MVSAEREAIWGSGGLIAPVGSRARGKAHVLQSCGAKNKIKIAAVLFVLFEPCLH